MLNLLVGLTCDVVARLSLNVLQPYCCRNAGSYGGERYRNMGQDGDGRKQHRANRPEPNIDVKPTERDVSSAPGQYCAVVDRICEERIKLSYYHAFVIFCGLIGHISFISL